MADKYPMPQDVGIDIPACIRGHRFCAGFEHVLKGGQLSQSERLKRLFRLGYRAAELYLREVRQRDRVLTFPTQGRVKIRVN